MSEDSNNHVVESKWREADAEAKAERVIAIMAWLDHTTDLVEMLADDEALSGELRGMAGTLRTKRNDISNEVEKLKAEMADRNRETK